MDGWLSARDLLPFERPVLPDTGLSHVGREKPDSVQTQRRTGIAPEIMPEPELTLQNQHACIVA